MLDDDARAASDRLELHLGENVVERARKRESSTGFPRGDAGPFEVVSRRVVVEDLHDPATDARLTAHLDHASTVSPEVDRAALPPEVHLFGERLEGGRGIHRDDDIG